MIERKPARKAVIPVAGLGMNLLPMTLAMPKAMLPVMSADNRLTPLVQLLVEEALSAGIERIALIVSPESEPYFRLHFDSEVSGALSEKCSKDRKLKNDMKHIEFLRSRIDYICQPRPEGLGDAIYRARDWVGDDWFLVVLGDHLFRSMQPEYCLSQLLNQSKVNGRSVLGVFRSPLGPDSGRCYAVVERYPNHSRAFVVSNLFCNPSEEEVQLHLKGSGPAENEYWCLLGAYLSNSHIFSILEKMLQKQLRSNGEIQLSDALAIQLKIEGMDAVEIQGESLDIGSPSHYSSAFTRLIEQG
jgi:UTP--glucose-1-phosphate uridylyltransferase